MFKVQIPDWHGDGWQELSNPIDTQSAAEDAAQLFISEAAAYDRIGKEPIVVHVDDGTQITTWNVDTYPSVDCHATQQVPVASKGKHD